MAGFREFVTGEVLTAANVDDFLAKQVVQKYADAAARDAALGTAVAGGNALREGMVAYLDDTDEVIKYDGSAWAAIGAAGIGSNVVQTVKDDTFTTASASFVAITGLTAAITPSSDSSKFLIIASLNVSNSNSAASGSTSRVRLTGGNASAYDGTAEGSRLAATASTQSNTSLRMDVTNDLLTMVYLDSPATASEVTYGVEIATILGLAVVNRTGIDTNADWATRTVSSITVIEVAA
jgi:hypothetical protein